MARPAPNIVLIFVDNQPAGMLGCAGNSEIHTPHLDGLAACGVRFSEAFCANAMCSPCRASVLTGLMPSQHGVHTWLDDGEVGNWPSGWNALEEFETLPESLSGVGYETALIGKYHLGLVDRAQNGFKEWVTLQTGHILSFYDNQMHVNGETIRYPGHSVDFFTERAVDYIDRRAADPHRPFFLFLTYPAPYGHWPSVKGESRNQFARLYDETRFDSVPREGLSRELVDWILVRQREMPDDEPGFYRQLACIPNDLPTLRNYYSQMSLVDDGVGRVLDALRRCRLLENTLVVYTSDHGMSLGEHGFWGHGEDTWPSNMHRQANHIPLIVKPPGSEEGPRVEDALVGTTDIFATIRDYAGLPPPPRARSSGRSVRPLIEGTDLHRDDAVFMEQEETRAIRTRRWLLMRRFGPTPYGFEDELYDLESDPDERRNVAKDPAHRADFAELSARIDAFFSRYSDARWDLWRGGTVKSNSTRPFLWREVWGEDWTPAC